MFLLIRSSAPLTIFSPSFSFIRGSAPYRFHHCASWVCWCAVCLSSLLPCLASGSGSVGSLQSLRRYNKRAKWVWRLILMDYDFTNISQRLEGCSSNHLTRIVSVWHNTICLSVKFIDVFKRFIKVSLNCFCTTILQHAQTKRSMMNSSFAHVIPTFSQQRNNMAFPVYVPVRCRMSCILCIVFRRV